MKVKELIEQLQKVNQEAEIKIDTSYERITGEFLSIEGITDFEGDIYIYHYEQ